MHSKQKPKKIGRYILLIILGLFIIFKYINSELHINKKVELSAGETFSQFVNFLPVLDQYRLKIYLKLSGLDTSNISEGIYIFSGDYTLSEYLDTIKKGPTKEYIQYVVLEGWSIYDIDYDLTKKGYIKAGEYVSFVTNKENIDRYKNIYTFIKKAGNIKTLEGFLYPDTYFIDISHNFISQLVDLQLKAFDSKFWDPNKDNIDTLISRIKKDYGLNLSFYDILSLASVVEKEERMDKNKPIISAIFLNRLSKGMRLDADITLCYGLHKPYEVCTPNVIAKGIYDESNVFNTRKKAGIPPQPISNPSTYTLQAIINYKKNNNIYYLHDMQGQIHYAETVAGHNINKEKYLH